MQSHVSSNDETLQHTPTTSSMSISDMPNDHTGGFHGKTVCMRVYTVRAEYLAERQALMRLQKAHFDRERREVLGPLYLWEKAPQMIFMTRLEGRSLEVSVHPEPCSPSPSPRQSRLGSLLCKLGAKVHQSTNLHHGNIDTQHVWWTKAQAATIGHIEEVQLCDLRLVGWEHSFSGGGVCKPGICNCYSSEVKIDACLLADDRQLQEKAAEMVKYIAAYGVPPLPADMLQKSTDKSIDNSTAIDANLAGAKNWEVQQALRKHPHTAEGIRATAASAAPGRTDPPAHHSGPTYWLQTQLQLLTIGRTTRDQTAPFANSAETRQVELQPDAEERLAALNSAFAGITLESRSTLQEYTELYADIRGALQKCAHGMGSKYVPMRIARAMVAPLTPPTDCRGTTIDELRAMSPDVGRYITNPVGNGRLVTDFDWHGIYPYHFTLWLCLWSSTELHSKYFVHSCGLEQ